MAFSCREPTPFHTDPLVDILAKVDKLQDLSDVSSEDKTFIMDTIRVFDWLSLWLKAGSLYEPQTGPHIREVDTLYPRLSEILKRENTHSLLEATQNNRTLWPGVCPASLWNLSVSQNDQHRKMLAIVEYLNAQQRQPIPQMHRTHKDCTGQLCSHAYEDTTKIVQLHKCSNQNCPTIDIPIDQLADLFKTPGKWVPSAWDISSWDLNASSGKARTIDKLISSPTERYMAVSHVWSDGTGVGLNKQGTVNSCLIDFWVRIARNFECTGLWWDTICLPTDSQARRNALNVMLMNFSKACVVVIHDYELAGTPWAREEQNTAIAMVLSNWFTRGWTAAEFNHARNVYVVLNNPNSSEPHIQCLNEITEPFVWRRPSSLPTLARLCAGAILGGLYDTHPGSLQTGKFDGLMSILKSRSTAWEKDRLIIAMLMTSPEEPTDGVLNPSLSIPVLTQQLLERLQYIPAAAIFHGEVPMAEYGKWSWCPPSIFGLGNSGLSLSQRDGVLPPTYVGEGLAHGWFYASHVRPEDVDELLPCGSHPQVLAQISAALKNPEKCLLLRTDGCTPKLSPALLAIPIQTYVTNHYKLRPYQSLCCRYVGCVYYSLPLEAPEQPIIKCEIGADLDGYKNTHAERVLKYLKVSRSTFELKDLFDHVGSDRDALLSRQRSSPIEEGD